MGGLLVCASILAIGYVTNSDVAEDKKTAFVVVMIILWVIALLVSIFKS